MAPVVYLRTQDPLAGYHTIVIYTEPSPEGSTTMRTFLGKYRIQETSAKPQRNPIVKKNPPSGDTDPPHLPLSLGVKRPSNTNAPKEEGPEEASQSQKQQNVLPKGLPPERFSPEEHTSSRRSAEEEQPVR